MPTVTGQPGRSNPFLARVHQVIDRRKPKHSAPGTPVERLLRTVLFSGSVIFLLVIVLLTVALCDDAPTPRAGTPTAAPPSVDLADSGFLEETAEPAEPTATPTPTRTPTPHPSPIAARPPRPDEILTQIRRMLPLLVRQRHLDAESAQDLDQRLAGVSSALDQGRTGKAQSRIRKTAEKVKRLYREKKLTTVGYQALAIPISQLAESISAR